MTGTFAFPTTVLFGAGRIAEWRDRMTRLGASRPLVVTDSGLIDTDTFKSVLAAAGAAPSSVSVFSDIRPNPSEADVRAATAAFGQHGCDSVVGVGGGSAIDVAKILRLRAKLPPQWQLREAIPAQDIGKLAPFVAVPTTAGTGSEVGRSSVITLDRQKHVVFHPSLLADVVILDPALTVGLPAKLTAATGADALTHCIESFTSPLFHPLCEGIALEGIHLIAGALPRAVKTPTDLDARGKMLVAATMGGIAFQKELGAAHSLAHPLSAICGLHHGLANALVLPTVMKFNAIHKPGVYARVGTAMGIPDPTDRATIDAVQSLLFDIGIASGLRAQGVKDSQLDALANQAFADGCHATNPVPVTRDDLYHLYQQAM
jgi:alcohol dehydrogenase class IV